MANLSRIGSDVFYYSAAYKDFPMGPRPAKIVGLGGGKDRYNVQVFNDNGRDPMRQPVVFFRNVLMVKPSDTQNETQFLVDKADLPKSGDWTIPPTISELPAPTKQAVGAGANKKSE